MALSGSTIASTFLKLLRMNSDTMGAGVNASYIQDSADTDSALAISQDRVGIGTDSPAARLDVSAVGTTTGSTLRVERDLAEGSTNAAMVYFNNSNALDNQNALVVNNDGSGNCVDFKNDGTAIMTVGYNGAGNVGIGTTSPDNQLHIKSANPSIRLEDTDTGVIMILFRDSAANAGALVYDHSDNHFSIRTDGVDDRLVIDSAGNVGIGITAPEALLDVRNDSLTMHSGASDILQAHGSDAGAVELCFSIGNDAVVENGAGCKIGFHPCGQGTGETASIIAERNTAASGANTDLRFKTYDGSSNTGLFQQYDGKVGIGTDSPAENLEVSSAASASCNVFIDAANGQNASLQLGANGDAEWKLINDTAGHASGGVNVLQLINDGSDEVLTILQDGNVGIGTNAPSYPLDVVTSTGNEFAAKFQNVDGVNPEGILIMFSGGDFTNDTITDDRAILYQDNDSDNFAVYSDGGIHADETDHISDVRLKENIVDASAKLEDINKLKVRNFNYKGKDAAEAKRIGFIADEIETVFPKIIKKRAIRKNGTDYTDLKMIRYEPIVAMLVKAIQELSAKVTALENNNQTGDSNNDEGNQGNNNAGESSSESAGEDSGGAEGSSSDSSGSSDGESASSESSSDDGDQGSGSPGSDASDDSEEGSGGDDSSGSFPGGEPSGGWTKEQLKAYMDAASIVYNSGDTKDDLLLKIGISNDSEATD